MITLGKVVKIEDSFLKLLRITDDQLVFEMFISVDDDQLIYYDLASLNVSVYSKIVKSPTFKTLSDAIKNYQVELNSLVENNELIKKFSIDLSTGYDSNQNSKNNQLLSVDGNYSSKNKSLLGIKSENQDESQDENTNVQVTFSNVVSSTRQLTYSFKILRSQLPATTLYFDFSLQSLKQKGNTYKNTAAINIVNLITKVIKLSSVPRVDLVLEKNAIYAKIDTSSDLSVKSVRVFKRTNRSSFSRLVDVDLDSSSAFLIIDYIQDFPETIYRFVNLNESGEESDSFVDRNLRTRTIESPVIYGEPISGGYRLFATSISKDALYGRFKYKDMTSVSSLLQTTGEFIPIVDGTCSSNILGFLRSNGLYEVTFEYVSTTGLTLNVGNFTFRNVPKVNDGISVEIQELNVDSSNLEVSFKLKYANQPSDNDLVKNLLTALDSAGLYEEDLKRLRSELSPLVAFQIYRLNLTTGDLDDLGIVENNFSDSVQRQITGASSLNALHTYRYQVKTLVRYPETVLTGLTQTIKGANKSYTLQPSKFLHPKSLEFGTLFSNVGLKTLFSQSEFEFGESGNVTTIKVAFDETPYTTVANNIVMVGTNEFLIDFNILGNVNNVDYYGISIQKSNGLTNLGRKFSSKNSVSFIVKIDDLDLEFEKIIVEPIFIDSKKGIPIEFNNTFNTKNLIGKKIAVVSSSGN